MAAGSHSSTLDRLYAWERKLYDEVKVHLLCCFCPSLLKNSLVMLNPVSSQGFSLSTS